MTKTKITLSAALKAIDDEPELPGEMPDDVWESLRSDRATMETVLRGIVQTTKQNIKGRIERVAQGRGPMTREEIQQQAEQFFE